MLHLRGRCLSSTELELLCRYLFILPNCVTHLSFVFLLLPLCPKFWINPCWATQDLWWLITSTGFAQPSHQWDPSNANLPCTSFPLRHLCLLHLPYLFSYNSFLPHNLLKGLCTFSLPHLIGMCEDENELRKLWVKCFWNSFFPILSVESQLTCQKCRLNTAAAGSSIY